jgi:uncharacterized membrane protein
VAEKWEAWLVRWIDAGLIDAHTAARVRTYETTHADGERLRWPIKLALFFGGLTLAAGVLLMVAAHWDELSPALRFGLVVFLVGAFHVGGALTEERFPAMALTLHAIGTIALGAGIYLAGQIFNLAEHWPGGLMLWALGASLAWALLKGWPQLGLTAILAPAWLAGEWVVAIEQQESHRAGLVIAAGLLMLTLTYFTAEARRHDVRRTLVWLGGIALLPAALALGFAATPRTRPLKRPRTA